MALREATALADKFITSLLFRVCSLPLHKLSRRAVQWRQGQGSNFPIGKALEEARGHVGHFSVRDKIDRPKGRSRHLTISALTLDREEGRCPALSDKLCSIYESRPLACRTAPLHYSMPLSVLGSYLDRFVRASGYLCDTTTDAPIVLDGGSVADSSVQQARDEAIRLAESERAWKNAILSLMDDPDAAAAAGLPTYEAVLRNSDAGSATTGSMLAGWRVARNLGLLSRQTFDETCQKQISLIKFELGRGPGPEAASDLVARLSEYELEPGLIF